MAKKTTTRKTAVSDPVSPEKLVEEIRQKAHELFIARGGRHGSDLSDWLKAEREIKAKYKI